MPIPGKLKCIENETGEPLALLIPRLLEKYDQKLYPVAIHLDVYPNSIRHWLKSNSYRFVGGKWQREEDMQT